MYEHHFHNNNITLLNKIEKINNLISNHEEKIANPLLEYISGRQDFKLIGKNKIQNKNRAPTISFTVNGKSSKDITKILINNKIATRNDNFYAWRCLKALNIDTIDGVVRLSLIHYNNNNDVKKTINALEKV